MFTMVFSIEYTAYLIDTYLKNSCISLYKQDRRLDCFDACQ